MEPNPVQLVRLHPPRESELAHIAEKLILEKGVLVPPAAIDVLNTADESNGQSLQVVAPPSQEVCGATKREATDGCSVLDTLSLPDSSGVTNCKSEQLELYEGIDAFVATDVSDPAASSTTVQEPVIANAPIVQAAEAGSGTLLVREVPAGDAAVDDACGAAGGPNTVEGTPPEAGNQTDASRLAGEVSVQPLLDQPSEGLALPPLPPAPPLPPLEAGVLVPPQESHSMSPALPLPLFPPVALLPSAVNSSQSVPLPPPVPGLPVAFTVPWMPDGVTPVPPPGADPTMPPVNLGSGPDMTPGMPAVAVPEVAPSSSPVSTGSAPAGVSVHQQATGPTMLRMQGFVPGPLSSGSSIASDGGPEVLEAWDKYLKQYREYAQEVAAQAQRTFVGLRPELLTCSQALGGLKSDKVCVHQLTGTCRRGMRCPDKHPVDAQMKKHANEFKRKQCRFGDKCFSPRCLYYHVRDAGDSGAVVTLTPTADSSAPHGNRPDSGTEATNAGAAEIGRAHV